MDWMRDPAWQFIGIVITLALAAIGGLYGLIRLYLFRTLKRLQYENVVSFSLLKITKAIGNLGLGDIKISLGSDTIYGLQTYVIKFINTGNVAILPSDYQSPIFVELPLAKRLIVAQVIEAGNEALKNHLNDNLGKTFEGPLVKIPPTLLNPGDWFSLACVTDEEDLGKTNVGGHIHNIREISHISRPRNWKAGFTRLVLSGAGIYGIICFSLGLLLIGQFGGLMQATTTESPELARVINGSIWLTFMYTSMFYVGVILLFLAVTSYLVYRRRART